MSSGQALDTIHRQIYSQEWGDTLPFGLPHRSLGRTSFDPPTVDPAQAEIRPTTPPSGPLPLMDDFGNVLEKIPLTVAPGTDLLCLTPSPGWAPRSASYTPAPSTGEVQVDGVESQLTPLTSAPPLLLGDPSMCQPFMLSDPCIASRLDADKNQGSAGSCLSVGMSMAEASCSNLASDIWTLTDPHTIQVDLSAWSADCGGSTLGQKLLVHSFSGHSPGGSNQRFIVLVHTLKDELYALDAKCHHMGGALWQGDIEELPEVGSCLRCPVHQRLISMSTGEVLQAGTERVPIGLETVSYTHLTLPTKRIV
eukprot:TRINITY_DN2474_c0_g5_i1.p1 TRINITY_DN2474_c0_g5~~TRINITY_DN2474_c0_g5_i1.p1  ORF type:complete len:309 (-),score=43.71 TRINITY_DN2474_c0_g5_i1:47-973(-)